MANTVTFKIKIEGSNELKNITVDANELGKAFDAVQANVKGLKSELVSLSSAIQVMDGFASAVGQIQNIFSGLSAAYSLQESAETRLAQAMRNTMGATDAEIQSIKNLTAAQQRIGIVGDEVQLSAAQELATYLEFSDSLKTIIPVMNDMIAQQLSLGASAESATQIATMLGKVMNGQTEALSRYGYKFDDAQKYILKYGEESERAAVLAEVVEQSVAGMNEAMARTPSGRMQQTANAIGDIKERLGEAVQGAMPLITTLAEITMAATGVLKLATAFQTLGNTAAIARVKSLGLAAAHRTQTIAARILGVSELQAATATGVLKAEIIALQAAMTFGLSLAIAGVVELLSRLFSRSKNTADEIEEVNKAQEAYRKAAADARAEIAADIVALEDLIKSKGREGDKVAELNRKYGDAFGTYSSAAEWYDILTSKSKEYCQQLAYEALANEYKAELAEAIKQKEEATTRANNVADMGHWKNGEYTDGYGTKRKGKVWEHGKEWTQAQKEMADAGKAVDDLTDKMTAAMQEANRLAEQIRAGGETATKTWKDMNLADLEKAIREQKALVESLAGGDDPGKAKTEATTLKQMEARAKALKKAYGLDTSTGSDKDKYDGSALIKNAATYKELGNNIKYYQNELEKVKPTETALIQQYTAEIQKLQEKQDALKALMDAAGVPTELNTLDDVNKAITFQQGLRRNASAENIAGIDAEIKRLNTLKMTMETGFNPEGDDSQIKTYAQLETALNYYEGELKNASEEGRAAIQAHINALEELKKKWDDTAAELKKPGEIGALNSIEDLDEAIAYYQARQKKASASEVASIQETILALQAKRKMMENISSLPEMQVELSGLEGLSDKRLKLELDLIGLDGIKDRIRSLQKMLDDTENPLDSTQRAQVEQLIGSYSSYQKILQKSNVTLADGWAGIKGIGDSVKNLTETLQGDGDAWEKVSSVIDSTLALYEGFKGVIEIIQMLTTVTNAHTLAKKAEGDENLIEAGKAAAAAGTEIGASEAVTIAKTTEAGAKTLDAGAGAASAVSSIPYVGPILAVAALASVIAAIMAIPKFANGGIAYGPTVGLFGEAGPEAIVPLDRLPDLIPGPDGGNFKVDFRIRGRDLRGLLIKEEQIGSRVG